MNKYYKAEDILRLLADDYYTQGKAGNLTTWGAIKDLPTIEVSEDCISREQVRAKLDYISYAEKDPILIAKRIVENAPSVIPQVSSEDCISREWVKGICENMLDEEMLGHMLGYIENAPSAVPKRAEGKPDFADCEKCSKIYGTLGCCSTVSNEWVYSCLEGMIDYAYTRGYKDGAKMKGADDD